MAKISIQISKTATKTLTKVPQHIREKFTAWVVAVQKDGLAKTRKQPGWHDEPLHGERVGQRSIRLNKQWRAIYLISKDGTLELIQVIEVTPHEYKK